jgi:hypothetical protein
MISISISIFAYSEADVVKWQISEKCSRLSFKLKHAAAWQPQWRSFREGYRNFLRAAPFVDRVRPGDLALPVLAIHSGGLALDGAADLGDKIASCIAEAKFYYTLGFDPANAKHVDEYHDLAVRVDKPQLRARTSTGYYAEPSFQLELPALGGK